MEKEESESEAIMDGIKCTENVSNVQLDSEKVVKSESVVSGESGESTSDAEAAVTRMTAKCDSGERDSSNSDAAGGGTTAGDVGKGDSGNISSSHGADENPCTTSSGSTVSEPGDAANPKDEVITKEAEVFGESIAFEPKAVEYDKPSSLSKNPSEDPLINDGKGGEAGIDNEMEAMFGESLSKSDVTSVSQSAPETHSAVQDDVIENQSKDDGKPIETPDDSALEVMMEKLHADKIGSPRSKPKPSESSGMELRDVLQALTEGDPSDNKIKGKTKNSAAKPCPKSKKTCSVPSESESGNEAPERRTTRSRVATQSSAKKGAKSNESSESEEENTRSLRKKRTESSNQGSSSNPKRKIVKEEESSDSEEHSESGNTNQRKGDIAKRPRGRPRKQPFEEREAAEKEEEKLVKHSKLGKKNMNEESSTDESSKSVEKSNLPKRGRGRPRKRSAVENTTEGKSKTAGKGKKTPDEGTGESSDGDDSVAKTPRSGRQPKQSNDGSVSEASSVPKGLRPTRKNKPSEKAAEKVNLVSRSNKVCIVTACRQHCLPSLGISLHRFPMLNNPMRAHWLALINETPPGPNTAYMCSKHFKENDYTYDESKSPTETFYRKLKPLAFPTVGLPVGKEKIEEVKARVADISAGKDPKEVTRGYLKEVKKKIKVEDETKDKPKGSSEAAEGSRPTSRAGSRSPSPRLVDNISASRTPAPKRKMDYESKARTPGTNCSVPCCGNNLFETRAEGLNISYYRFPFDDALAARWIKKIGDPDLVARTARICSDHFLDKDFEGTLGGKRNLKPKAVPSQYLTVRKPRDRDLDHEEESAEDDSDDERYVKKKAKIEPKKPKKPKPDTSFITMPLPIIEDLDIKSEPASDDEVVGQEYAPSDPGSDNEEAQENEAVIKEKVKTTGGEEQDDDELEDEEPTEVKRGRGRPKKDAPSTCPRKIVTFGGLSLPVINVERLGQRVIDAAESGSLRVRIKESTEANKARSQQKPTPKLKRKLPESDTESPPKVMTRPGPLCKKKKLVVNTPIVPKKPRSQKVLKMSDFESSDSDVDDPNPVQAEKDVASTSFAKSPNPIKVKLAELPTFLRDRAGKEGGIPEDATMDITSEELDAIMNSDKSEKDKIIQLVEQRISEHTKIIEGKSMGAQELADHNKILQGSALVLKKLAEKSGKPLTPSQVISLNVPDSTSVTTGRTIVLKKVPDPGKLGLKPLRTVSSPTSPLKPPTAIVTPQSSPARALKSAVEDLFPDDSKQPASALEKIRDYDNLMKKYLSAVLDKNVLSKKYTESKEAQKLLENKLSEKIKECDNLKRKAASLNAKMNRINTALEYFLTPNQIKLALQETKKVAWSPEEMLTAFTIKHLSKACYLFLRHKLNYPLPGISSLQRWMTMLSKDKTGDDDDDHIADEDLSDKEESQEILVEGPDVVNEISGTLEEINAGGVPGEEDEFVSEENVQEMKDLNQSSPFQVVFDNEGDSNSNRKVIILKKMPNADGKLKMKSKLQISASKNDVNVSNMEESDDKNELYKLLPGAKTISMSPSPNTVQKRKVLVTKNSQEKEKITFQRLPQVRKEVQKPPTIHVVKSEPQEELRDFIGGEEDVAEESMQMEVTEIGDHETVVKPEDVSHPADPAEDQQQQRDEQDGTEQKYFTISDLNATQMEEHIVENVEHSTEEGQMVEKPEQQGEEACQQLETGAEGGESVQDTSQVVHHGASGLEELVQLATSGEQHITFATTEELAQAGQFAQIAYAQGGQGEITYTQEPQGDITLSEDINNMTAVVIDEDQLNTIFMSNVVEGKSDQPTGQFGQKKIVYQTIDDQKNVIVLQPDSQAFIEEDEGSNTGAPRVYIINDEGHIVSSDGREPRGPSCPPRNREISFVGPSGPPSREISFVGPPSRQINFAGPSGPPPSQLGFEGPSGPPRESHEIGFIDSSSFAELGLKLAEPETFSIGNLIQNYAINSPTRPPRK